MACRCCVMSAAEAALVARDTFTALGRRDKWGPDVSPTVPAAADSTLLSQARWHPVLFPSGEQHMRQCAPMVFLCPREAKPVCMCRPALIADPARLAPHIFGNPVRQVIVHPHQVYQSGFAPEFRAFELARYFIPICDRRFADRSP
jgi:hypothetical protein